MSDVKPTLLEVVDKLATLGSPDQIAAFFEQEGITGNIGTASSCPISNYVARETGQMVNVDSWMVVGTADIVNLQQDERYENISLFVRCFDSGKYLHLLTLRPFYE